MGAHKTSAAGLVAQIMSGDITPLVKVVNVTCVPYLYCFLFGAWAYKNWDRVHWVFEGRFIFLDCRLFSAVLWLWFAPGILH